MKRYVLLPIILTSMLSGQTTLDRGKELLEQRKYREAIGQFRQLLDTSPRNAEAWRMLGEAYLRIGVLDSAEMAARRALSIDDERPEPYMTLSDVLAARKNRKEAISTLRSAIKNKVATASLLTHLGFLQLSIDSLDQAIVAFSQAKEANHAYGLAYEGLGDAYYKQGVPAIAILQYEKGIEVDSLRPSLYYKLAKAYFQERRYTDAAKAWHTVIGIDPTNTGAQLELGKLYFAAKQYANAANILKLYVESKAPDGEALLMYAEALLLSRQYETALATAEKILKTDPRSIGALRVAANSYSELDRHEKALTAFQRLRNLDTLRVDDYRRLARSYSETKQDSLAASVLEQALRADSTELDLYNELGATYMRVRNWEKAAAAFENRFQKDPNPYSALSAYVNYAACMMALENWERARWALRTALGIRPQYIPGYIRLGLSLTALDSLDEAKKVYETVIVMTDTASDKDKYKTEIIDAHQQTGFIFLRQKKYAEAVDALNRADRLKPNDKQTLLWRAQAYHLTKGKEDEAIRDYKKVLRIDPTNKDAKRGLELLEPQ